MHRTIGVCKCMPSRLSSKGQLAVPRAGREALSLFEGDEVVFRVEGERAVLSRSGDLLALAGSEPLSAPLWVRSHAASV